MDRASKTGASTRISTARAGETQMAVILIVDDEALIALAYQNALRDAGHTVLMASDGQRALDLLKEALPTGGLPDVIITDYMMPRMDGAELVRALRDDPRLAGVPIIMNTALSPDVIAAKRLPLDAVLHKPVDAGVLLRTVARVLRQSSQA